MRLGVYSEDIVTRALSLPKQLKTSPSGLPTGEELVEW